MLEELDPILIQTTIPLPIAMVHAAFTDPARMCRWLCDEARVEPRVGGAYELAWSGPEAHTSAGTVTTFTPDVDIGFSWIGPRAFDELMNRPTPRTRVYVRLQESPAGIDVTLEHQGWGSGAPWEEARSWHFQFWHDHLQRLKDSLLKDAYG
jgi:uncharacterized protein YndB with AHSA1/START domain